MLPNDVIDLTTWLIIGAKPVIVFVSFPITPSRTSLRNNPKWTSDPLVQSTMMTAVLLSLISSSNILSYWNDCPLISAFIFLNVVAPWCHKTSFLWSMLWSLLQEIQQESIHGLSRQHCSCQQKPGSSDQYRNSLLSHSEKHPVLLWASSLERTIWEYEFIFICYSGLIDSGNITTIVCPDIHIHTILWMYGGITHSVVWRKENTRFLPHHN